MNINLFAPLCSSDPIVPEGNDRKERFSNWLVREMGPMFEVWWQALLSAAVFILKMHCLFYCLPCGILSA